VVYNFGIPVCTVAQADVIHLTGDDYKTTCDVILQSRINKMSITVGDSPVSIRYGLYPGVNGVDNTKGINVDGAISTGRVTSGRVTSGVAR